MCYADTTTNADGTATAFCYCGWVEEHATPDAADYAAETHQRNADATETEPAATH
ncbi:hypothetical protein [Amycolatopsis sp. 195334CR]|uniref:hypothetical protein n=1 Tax=Amycolatopsis sp. 195334CR TaxID=2814588 RepID=UPI001A8D73FB|nr:hypothetical protein [Amycolatopsis sp. 195334CR]MBN6034153.1 hypothetical protein [Amycolatopsis sp. 195334CR]